MYDNALLSSCVSPLPDAGKSRPSDDAWPAAVCPPELLMTLLGQAGLPPCCAARSCIRSCSRTPRVSKIAAMLTRGSMNPNHAQNGVQATMTARARRRAMMLAGKDVSKYLRVEWQRGCGLA